jgi:hypothetical protein
MPPTGSEAGFALSVREDRRLNGVEQLPRVSGSMRWSGTASTGAGAMGR